MLRITFLKFISDWLFVINSIKGLVKDDEWLLSEKVALIILMMLLVDEEPINPKFVKTLLFMAIFSRLISHFSARNNDDSPLDCCVNEELFIYIKKLK